VFFFYFHSPITIYNNRTLDKLIKGVDMKLIETLGTRPRKDGKGTRRYGLYKCMNPDCGVEKERIINNVDSDLCSKCNALGNTSRRVVGFMHPNLIYTNLELKPHRVYGIRCDVCGKITERRITIEDSIPTCCTTCNNKTLPKKSTNTSGYIGVYRASTGVKGAEKDRWISQIVVDRKQVRVATYMDYENDYDTNRLLCAIDRDNYIIAHELPHTRNFTDDELLTLLDDTGFEIFKNKHM